MQSRIAQVQSRFPSENLYLTEPIDVLHVSYLACIPVYKCCCVYLSQAYAVKAPRKSQPMGSVSPSPSRVQTKLLR